MAEIALGLAVTDVPDRIKLYSIPIVISSLVLIGFLLFNAPETFPADNVRYTYSAIFQGFAAILALMVTAILITRQNMHSQKFSVEERIYKILGKRFDQYIPGTILEIKQEIESDAFQFDFQNHIENTTDFTPAKQKLLFDRIMGELRRKFNFLKQQQQHEKKLGKFFKISLGLIIVILIYSLTALLVAVPDNYTNPFFENDDQSNSESSSFDNFLAFLISPFTIVFICAILVLVSLEIFAFFIIEIGKIWNLKID